MKEFTDRSSVRGASIRDWARRRLDRDLLPVLVLFWIISVVRVVGAFARSETFGAEATLALIAVVLIPSVVLVGRRRKPD